MKIFLVLVATILLAPRVPIAMDEDMSAMHLHTNDITMSQPKYKEVEPLLKKYTCLTCHHESKKMIGPTFKEIAKRNYTDINMLKLIWKPEPTNWPDFKSQMVPMPQVKKDEGVKITAWINSLR